MDTAYVETVFKNTLLKESQRERKYEEEDVRSYCMTK